ncbi:class-III glutamine aminotransferase, partial [Helicosporidium sp. ATCC 50920]
ILQRASVVLSQRAVPRVARAVAVRTPSRTSVAEERLPLPPTTADGYIPAVADAEDLLKEHGACGVGLVASVHNERSREIVDKAIMALGCMEHRGGCAADDVSGDGAGVMTEIPWDLLRVDFPALREGSCGVGQVFFPDHDGAEAACRALFAEEAKKAGFELLGWRCVPVDVAAIGPAARRTLPRIRQVALRWTGE